MMLLRRGPTDGVRRPGILTEGTLPAPYALTVPELVVDELLTMAVAHIVLSVARAYAPEATAPSRASTLSESSRNRLSP